MAGATPAGKVALVTGGTGPIGSAVAAALAAAGARVATIHDDRSAAASERSTATEAGSGPAGVTAFRADVGDPTRLDAAIERIRAELGEIDILVAGAGHRVTGSFLELDAADLERTIEVEAYGALLCAQRVARSLLARGAAGRIVFLTTAAGLRAVPGSCGHAIAQAMKTTLAQVAAVELGGAGITCNVVASGWVESPFLASVDRDLVIESTPAGRLVDPAEIAEVCAFLASEQASAVNGAVISVDGGYAVTKSAGGSPLRQSL